MSLDNVAEKLSKWFGSAPFILLHLIWFISWVMLHFIINLDPGWKLLTIIVSLEAIFLALFILRAENVQSRRIEKISRDDLKTTRKIHRQMKKP